MKTKPLLFMFSLYTNSLDNVPSYTQISSYMVWRVDSWAKYQVPSMLARSNMEAKSQGLSPKEPLKYA